MPTRLLSDPELEQLMAWPPEVAHSDLVEFFTLGREDLRWLRSHAGTTNRLGLAIQVCALRYLGFIPDDVGTPPAEILARVAKAVGAAPSALSRYVTGVSARVRREHAVSVLGHCGWVTCGKGEFKQLRDWLLARALERDNASLLFGQALEHLRAEKIVRPGLHTLMRTVASTGERAHEEISWRLRPQLTPERCALLDPLVVTDTELGVAPLVWLGEGATSWAPESIKEEIVKLSYLRRLGADRLDLSAIPPERLRQMATVGRRSSPKALKALAPQRRYPVLAATLAGTYTSVVDEVVQMFDQALAGTDSRARKAVATRQQSIAEANIERLGLLDEILDVVLDPELDDAGAGAGVRGLGADRLSAAVRSDDERLPRDGGHLAVIEASYSHIRSFAPQVLAALTFQASVSPSEVLDAVVLLQKMNAENRRHVPGDAPVGFVPERWQPYLRAARSGNDENSYKHYWEICALFALQGALRSGEIWVQGSRRYANIASYLIPPEEWPRKQAEVAELTGMPATFAERLARIDEEYTRYLNDLEVLLADGNGAVRLDENGELHLSPLAAEVLDPEVDALKDGLFARVPVIPVAEAIIEVDRVTGFSRCLPHPTGATPKGSEMEHRRHLYGYNMISQACNFGSTRMAELTGIPADTLDWYTLYLREEANLRAANAVVVNEHHHQWLAQAQGGGTLSSSDGLRLPMRGKSLTARALSRYFTDQGVTTYCHVSDQHSTFGTRVIVSTERDGLYVLDEILGNTTELPIVEHTTDTHGQMFATFALFDFVGKKLSPRIAKIADKPRFRPHPATHYERWPLAGPLLSQHAQIDLIAEHWDDLRRIAGSLILGYVSASLLVARLQAGSRQHPLAKALLEYGKLMRTLHALRWFTDEAFRRRISSTSACSASPGTSRTPSRPRRRWATGSVTRPRRTSARRIPRPSTPTAPTTSTSPQSSAGASADLSETRGDDDPSPFPQRSSRAGGAPAPALRDPGDRHPSRSEQREGLRIRGAR